MIHHFFACISLHGGFHFHGGYPQMTIKKDGIFSKQTKQTIHFWVSGNPHNYYTMFFCKVCKLKPPFNSPFECQQMAQIPIEKTASISVLTGNPRCH